MSADQENSLLYKGGPADKLYTFLDEDKGEEVGGVFS